MAVLPSELPEEWDAHRESIVQAFSPADSAELMLVERMALLMWRLRRVAQYEVAVTTAAMDAENTPYPKRKPLNPRPADLDDSASDEDRLSAVRGRLRDYRKQLRAVNTALKFMTTDWLTTLELEVPFETAEQVLQFAQELALKVVRRCPHHGDAEFLKRIGLTEIDFFDVNWNAGKLIAGVAQYCVVAEKSIETMLTEIMVQMTVFRNDLADSIKEKDREVSELHRFIDRSKGWRTASVILPPDHHEAKITRYEAHLNRQFGALLLQYEQLKALRSKPSPSRRDRS